MHSAAIAMLSCLNFIGWLLEYRYCTRRNGCVGRDCNKLRDLTSKPGCRRWPAHCGEQDHFRAYDLYRGAAFARDDVALLQQGAGGGTWTALTVSAKPSQLSLANMHQSVYVWQIRFYFAIYMAQI
jgi:hypothetical protein